MTLRPPTTQTEVMRRCARGQQWCDVCTKFDCGDNTNKKHARTNGTGRSPSTASADGSAAGVGAGRKAPKLPRLPPKVLVLRHQKEGEIQREILRFLGVERRDADGELTGVFVSRQGDGMFWRQNSGAAKKGARWITIAPAGTADILGCVAGAFVALEVKREGEYQSQAQLEWQRMVESAGGIYRVVRSASEALAVVEEVRRA